MSRLPFREEDVAKVASALRLDITSGTIPPGASLDYYRAGSPHGVGGHVVVKALAVLRREQIVMWRDHWWYATPAGPPSPAASARLGATLAAIRTRLGLTVTDLAMVMAVGHISPRETVALRTADILAVEDGAWRGRWLWKQADAATISHGSLLAVHDRLYSQPIEVTRAAASATPDTR
jgi:hypothetical protein